MNYQKAIKLDKFELFTIFLVAHVTKLNRSAYTIVLVIFLMNISNYHTFSLLLKLLHPEAM